MLAIIVPDYESVAYLLSKVTVVSDQQFAGMHFITAKRGTYVFLIVISGSGKVNTGAAVALACKNYSVNCLLGIGTCATLAPCRLPLLGAVVCCETLQYDVNFSSMREPCYTLPGMNTGLYHACHFMTKKALCACRKASLCAEKGRVCSADCFLANGCRAYQLRCGLHCMAADVECGALGQMAHLMEKPFTVIKVAADTAGCCAGAQYGCFEKRASMLAQDAAYEYIKMFS